MAESSIKSKAKRSYNICIVSDFFLPALGGVEMHIFQLALCLIERGHKVVIVTHYYGNRAGVRFITNGIKSTSPLGNECLIHAKAMGYKAIFTDHSLFGFDDAACIHLNKALKFILSDIDQAICVSHTTKENLTLRASLNPHILNVIPNAVDISRFTPDPSKRYPLNTINIVYIARWTFRKGVDLLVDLIPPLCKKYPELHFILGGDGPKRPILEKMIEIHGIQDRTELLGSIPHKEVRNVLVRGHIFLNTSITESFCIANLEAAASGLIIVSTNVGGISEALPEDLVALANPDPQDLMEKLEKAILQAKNINSQKIHDRIKGMYSWRDVAARTEKVYDRAYESPRQSLLERIKKYYSCGPVAGIALLFWVFMGIFLLAILNFIDPAEEIEPAVDFPYKEFHENKDKYGDYKLNVMKNLKKKK